MRCLYPIANIIIQKEKLQCMEMQHLMDINGESRSFVELLMRIHVLFRLPYRQVEGFMRKIWDLVPEI